MEKIERVKLNIPGLDALIKHGVPKGELILLSGTAGTGKTIFGIEYLYLSKEPGVFVTFEDQVQEIKHQASCFGWDLDTLERKNKLRILKYEPYRLEDIFTLIENNIREIKATRVVIDSISAFAIHLRGERELRTTLLEIYDILKKNGCTSILTCENPPQSPALSRFGVEEFVFDGVIVLRKLLINNEYKRAIHIWKLRGTQHSNKFYEYEIIDKKGLVVYPKRTINFKNVKFFT